MIRVGSGSGGDRRTHDRLDARGRHRLRRRFLPGDVAGRQAKHDAGRGGEPTHAASSASAFFRRPAVRRGRPDGFANGQQVDEIVARFLAGQCLLERLRVDALTVDESVDDEQRRIGRLGIGESALGCHGASLLKS